MDWNKNKIALSIKLCVGYFYCPPVNSKWFNVCFTRDSNEEINMLREKYSNAECLIIADFNCRIGKRQVELPHLFDVWENWMLKAIIFGDKRYSKDKNCTAEGKKLVSFCATNNLKISNGKFGPDKRLEFTFTDKLGSSVINYTLVSEGIINNILGFKIRVEIISSHMPMLSELEKITDDTNNNTNIICQIQLQKLVRYKWNNNYKYVFTERMNDTAGRICMYVCMYVCMVYMTLLLKQYK